MLNLARNLKNNTLAAQNIIKQDNQVSGCDVDVLCTSCIYHGRVTEHWPSNGELIRHPSSRETDVQRCRHLFFHSPAPRLWLHVFFFFFFPCFFTLFLKHFLLLIPHLNSVWPHRRHSQPTLHESVSDFTSAVTSSLFPSSPDSEPVDASGRPELWEAEDRVRAAGAAHQEVRQLAAVADAHPGLLHLYQHDPLHPNLPPTPMMSVYNPELLVLHPPVFTEQLLHRPIDLYSMCDTDL